MTQNLQHGPGEGNILKMPTEIYPPKSPGQSTSDSIRLWLYKYIFQILYPYVQNDVIRSP